MHADAGMANQAGRNQLFGGEHRSHESNRERDAGRDREMRGRDSRDWHDRDFASDTERDDRFMPDYNDGSSDRHTRADRPYYGDRGAAWHGAGNMGANERGPHYGKGPQGFTRSDERIKELVSEALHDDDHVDASGITVDVKSGEVTLSGSIDDRRAKRMAEDCVLRVSGVKDVQNQLRVRDQRAPSAHDATQGHESSSSNGSKHLRS